MKKRGKTCYNCQHSRIIPDTKVVDCLHSEVDFGVLDKYKRNPMVIPQYCGQYTPEMVQKCRHCEKIIHHPLYNWQYWVEDVFEDLPVCSRKCQEELQAELDRRTDNFRVDFQENDDEKGEYPF